MRIIGGARRGKLLENFADGAIRPTSDRAREAIFNILAHQSWVAVDAPLPEGARVLDLACGTGALGCEALSRGAAAMTFYDNHAPALKVAQRNAVALNLPADVRVEYADLAQLPACAQPYDLVFCDPPYKQGLGAAALAQLVARGYLHETTVVMVETGAGEALDLPDQCRLLDSRRYGAAKAWFISLI